MHLRLVVFLFPYPLNLVSSGLGGYLPFDARTLGKCGWCSYELGPSVSRRIAPARTRFVSTDNPGARSISVRTCSQLARLQVNQPFALGELMKNKTPAMRASKIDQQADAVPVQTKSNGN